MPKTENDSLPWNRLSKTAQQAVGELVVLLAKRFTGEITLQCIEGGVREFRESRHRHPAQLRDNDGAG